MDNIEKSKLRCVIRSIPESHLNWKVSKLFRRYAIHLDFVKYSTFRKYLKSLRGKDNV